MEYIVPNRKRLPYGMMNFAVIRREDYYYVQSGMSSKQVNGAKKVLTAAALTYVAAALTSIIQLLYLMARYNRNSNR